MGISGHTGPNAAGEPRLAIGQPDLPVLMRATAVDLKAVRGSSKTSSPEHFRGTGEDWNDLVRLANAKATCDTLFYLFVAAVVSVAGMYVPQLKDNVIVSLLSWTSVVGAPLSVVYVPLRWSVIRRLPHQGRLRAKISAIGLVVLAVLAFRALSGKA
jgi:hypothetical protein